MNVTPLGTNVLVQIMPFQEEKQKGLIWVPQNRWDAFRKCKVIAVGKGKKLSADVRVPLNITIGEYVVITRYAGTIIYVDHKEYRFVKPIDILAVITEE